MESALAISSTSLPFHKSNRNIFLPSAPFPLFSKTLLKPSYRISITAKSSNFNTNPSNESNKETPFAQILQNAAKTLVLTVAGLAAILMISKLKKMPAKVGPLTPTVEEEKVDNLSEIETGSEEKSPVCRLIESNSEHVEYFWKMVQIMPEIGENALKILDECVEAEPSEIGWKILRARLLSEMGITPAAKEAFEEILALNPLSFETLFQNALLMERCGEGLDVIVRLEKALSIAMDENKVKEARDVRLIIAQIKFLQKGVEEALKDYEELSKEDPKDFRPYFCKGMIYGLLDRNVEAREEFAKYKALSGKEFDVEGFAKYKALSGKEFDVEGFAKYVALSPKKFDIEEYLKTPVSRMKLFGMDSQRNL